ncbi:MAG TPA: DUF1592 domain-containing protein [Isosphaeraceae bacterium]
MPRRRTIAVCLAILLGMSVRARGADTPPFEKVARPVLEKFCLNCHGDRKPKAGVSVAKFKDAASLAKDADLAQLVADSIADGTMPPKDKPAPSETDRQAAADAIESALAELENVKDPGPSLIQRLTRRQYNNTIRDLLDVHTNPADAFPTDGGGGGGFDNNASTLFVPPILMEKYLAAAVDVLDKADPRHWRAATPGGGLSKEDAARKCFESFAPKAFRRPVSKEEIDRLMTLFRRADARGDSFDASVKLGLRAVLVSPHFLFLVERDGPTGEAYRITDYELATRLSYFLWSSTPDGWLYELAAANKLHEPDVLEKQVERMLADPKARALATDFAAQWLRVDTLALASEPDRGKFPSYTHELRDAMTGEPIALFHALLREDAPITDLIGADYTYLNETLAKHYGVEGVKGAEFRKVAMKDRARGGVLGMGAILTLTSYPQRTSPVLRGKWVLEEILGTPPPPPPSMVKVLPPDDRPKDNQTFRQRLEAHRKDASCAGCHAKLDPIGFGLESFDPIGRLRTEIGGAPVDAAGKLTTGESFTGPAELKKVLCESKRELFVKNVAGRMLSYALRRGLEYYDQKTVKGIAATLEEKGYKTRVLVAEIVKSYPFQYRRNEPVGRDKP